MKRINAFVIGLFMAAAAANTQAAFIIEVDTDGADDAAVTYHPNFAFAGDTTTASTSSAALGVPGLTGGNSIFGGNAVNEPDTYVFRYTPGIDADNFSPAPATPINATDAFRGIAGGVTGNYRIYATWPFTTGVSAIPTTYTLNGSDSSSIIVAAINQNNPSNAPNSGFGNQWLLLGEVALTQGVTYKLVQTSSQNTFVSMRAAGIMFEAPEPASAALLLGIGCLITRRRPA
ncbi:MAG: hypothetical protein RIG82_03280 [Phycisphaeraceae bacterium]